MTSNMNISAENYDYFAVEGTVDAASERYFRELPAKVTQSRVRLDFANAGRINSMGIALLLRCLKEMKEKKQAVVTLEGLAPMHTMLFKMTGVFLLATPSTDGKGAVS
jgi:anti-anti-sigma regulatory factor